MQIRMDSVFQTQFAVHFGVNLQISPCYHPSFIYLPVLCHIIILYIVFISLSAIPTLLVVLYLEKLHVGAGSRLVLEGGSFLLELVVSDESFDGFSFGGCSTGYI